MNAIKDLISEMSLLEERFRVSKLSLQNVIHFEFKIKFFFSKKNSRKQFVNVLKVMIKNHG